MDSKFSQSLDRGLAILASFTPERPTVTIAELAGNLSISRSTAQRYVATLVGLGYLRVDDQRNSYRLTPRVTRLGLSAMSSISAREHARPYLCQLSRETGLTASLAVLDGSHIVYLDRVRGLRQTRLDTRVNARLPAYCTAAGKVLLAALPLEEQRQLIGRMKLTKHAPNTIVDERELRAALERAADDGLSLAEQELAPGVLAIAAPVRLANGEVLAAIDLIASGADIGAEKLRQSLSATLLTAAARLSARLGYRPAP